MGLYFEDDDFILLKDDELFAVRKLDCVEVWDYDGEQLYGKLGKKATVEDVQIAYEFWKNGYKVGEVAGEFKAQFKIRRALGL